MNNSPLHTLGINVSSPELSHLPFDFIDTNTYWCICRYSGSVVCMFVFHGTESNFARYSAAYFSSP